MWPTGWGLDDGIELRPMGPSPGPSPLVPRGEGRIRSRYGRDCAAPASAPTGSLRLATSPKTAGGGWCGRQAGGSATIIALRRQGAPLPALSFLEKRGESMPMRRGPPSPPAPGHATWQARARTSEPPVREGGLRVVVAANSFAREPNGPTLRLPQPPPAVSGEVRAYASGGGARGSRYSRRLAPHPLLHSSLDVYRDGRRNSASAAHSGMWSPLASCKPKVSTSSASCAAPDRSKSGRYSSQGW